MSKTYDYKFKLILCGDSSVGKSSLIHHFLYKKVGGATPEPGKHTYVSCRVLRQLRHVYMCPKCLLSFFKVYVRRNKSCLFSCINVGIVVVEKTLEMDGKIIRLLISLGTLVPNSRD